MSTKKVIGGSVAAIVILIIAQLAAQLAASALFRMEYVISLQEFFMSD
mgnify:CR=1 FL=1